MIDPAIVEAAERTLGRKDLLVTIARPDEYAEIERLSRSAPTDEVQSPLTAELVEWFVDRNPCGPGFVVVARDPATREMVGHFVFYRWELARREAGGSVVALPVFLYVRLFVDASVRRRGVFASMTTFGLELVKQLGVGLAYTAPNPHSAAGFVKFGMEARGPLPFWIRPGWRPWRWIGGLGPRGGQFQVRRRAAFDSTLETALARQTWPAASVWSPRDVARLNWRYVDRPDIDYEIRDLRVADRPVGYLVTRRMTIKGRSVLAVCDAWTEPEHVLALRAGLEDAMVPDAPQLVIAIGGSAAPALRSAFRRAGFLRCPTPLLPQPVAILGGGVGDPAVRVDLPVEPTWHLTPYDWDVF